jgi:DNA topoisomerase-3
VEHGQRRAADFMAEIEAYTREIVEHAKNFEYEELYAKDAPLGPCPACGRPVVEAPWFYRCQEKPERDPDCPLRIWKDTSGRYIDRNSARTLVLAGKTGALEGFTARNGRTYQALLEIDREAWQVKVRPVAWEEGMVREDPEYEVNTEPVGVCPFEEECHVVESSTQFICERKLKETDLGEGVERPKSCGFVFPRTVCKREITRDEAIQYVTNKRTELLTDFTSRFGRPFSAMLVLKETGRHGFEFMPRAPRAGAAPAAEGDATSTAPKRAARGGKRAKAVATDGAAEAAAKPARKPAARSRKAASKSKPKTRPRSKTPKNSD